MAKTVQAQQKWEYMTITRKSDTFLVHDLNELGQQGWDMISVSYMKNMKGAMVWTAFLKRPSTETAVKSATTTPTASNTPTPQPEQQTAKETPKVIEGFDLSGDEFELHAEPEAKKIEEKEVLKVEEKEKE